MARKKTKKHKRPVILANKDWARFCAGYHGRGAHRDQTAYRRKAKHSTLNGEHYDA
jgi:hypothetical protein